MFANQKFADTNYVGSHCGDQFWKTEFPHTIFQVCILESENYLTVTHDRPLVSFCWTAILILTSTFFFNLKAVSARRGKT